MSGSTPTNGKYLLDTNIAIAILESNIDFQDRRKSGLEAFLNATVMGELFFGAEKSARVEENRTRIRNLAKLLPVLACDENTGEHYGAIKQLLQQAGRPIPENDIWIAASARQHGLTLVTRDAHFKEVEGLVVETW